MTAKGSINMKKAVSVLLISVIMLTLLPLTAFAREVEGTTDTSFPDVPVTVRAHEEATTEKSSPDGRWVHKKHKYFYYRGKKRLKGRKKINGKYYFFDKNGVQRTGWRLIKGNYYFFRLKNGAGGYMVKNKTVNDVKLRKNGKAVIGKNEAHLKVLIGASEVVDKATKPDMKKKKKKKKCFEYTVENYKYRGDPKFYYSSNWSVVYANRMMTEFHGSCYEYGAWFAYIANACGIKECYAVSSGGHGWSEINGKICDPSWEQIDKRHNYFMMDKELSGKGGIPNYKRAERYKTKI